MSERLNELGTRLLDTIDEFTADDGPLTTGEVMGALFSLFVLIAKESPGYDGKKLVSETDEKIRQAVAA